jgi:two-component system OmpR family response regulator
MADDGLSRILYVEDDADIRSVATFALETLGGFTVAGFESGAQAIAAAEAFAPQMLLLDVPTTLIGLQAIPTLRDVPAIFMTAKVQPQEVTRYLAMGALDVIAKPFDPMALSDLVRAIWERRPR